MSEQPAAAIRAAIEDHGPIPFSEFMELALYGHGGFYEEPPVGEQGHFVTSPHIHPIFATMLAKALYSMWERLERPVPFRVIELGAGDGTLARHLLTESEAVPLDYVAVERSAGARRSLEDLPITVAPSLEALDERETAVVFANELFDNVPFERVRRTRQGLMKVFVGAEGNRLVAVERRWPGEIPDVVPELGIGEEGAVSFEAVRIVERLAGVMARGYALLIDYGGVGPTQVHGYRRHVVIADVLSDPGTADITAGVDLDGLGRHAERLGMRRLRSFSQRSALTELGIVDWMREQRKLQGILLDQGAGLQAVKRYEERNRASLLMDPAGLGGLRWLLLGTADLGWPEWAERAADADS